MRRRRRVARCLAAGAIALLAAGQDPAAANVFGHDDRRPLLPEDGFGAVGQIACAGSTRLPVATLIDHPALPAGRAHDLVITVAHAFVGGDGAVGARCDFRPGGDPDAAVPVLRVALGTLEPARAWHHDWAVAVIGDRVSDIHGALPLRSVSETDLPRLARAGARYQLVGKNGERPGMLISENCGPVSKRHWHHGFFNDSEFNHDCDMIAGWSGGPLVMHLDGGRAIVAVNATEMNGIVHRHGQPFHPRMFPNTAIRVDGDFLATVDRLARAPMPAPWTPPDLADPLRLAVVPQGCSGTADPADAAGDVIRLAAELALVPAAQATELC